MSNNEYIFQQTYQTITYDWREYNLAISEINKLQSDKERATKAVDYMKNRDLSNERYLFLFETARQIANLIDVNQIENMPIFKRHDFITNVFMDIYNYFNLSDKNLQISYDFIPFYSRTGEYRSKTNKIWINEPIFYTKHTMIFYAGAIFHEFWHYLQSKHPDMIKYYFSDEKLTFNKYKLSSKQKFILYRNKPLEQEGWFVGYALIYFLDKKTKFKYASKMIQKLAKKSDKTVIEVLKNIDKVKY